MLPKILAVLNASFFKIQAMWQTPTLFSVPYPAYRLLIDFLQRDKVFCNDFIPVFRAHEVILYLKKDTDEKKHLQQADISYSCTSVAGVVPLKNTGEFTEKRVFVFMKEVGCKPSGPPLLVAIETAGVAGLKEPASWPHLVQWNLSFSVRG